MDYHPDPDGYDLRSMRCGRSDSGIHISLVSGTPTDCTMCTVCTWL